MKDFNFGFEFSFMPCFILYFYVIGKLLNFWMWLFVMVMLSKVHSKMKATENPFRNLQDSESLPAVQVLLFMTLETLERLVFLGRFNGFRICSDSTLGNLGV